MTGSFRSTRTVAFAPDLSGWTAIRVTDVEVHRAPVLGWLTLEDVFRDEDEAVITGPPIEERDRYVVAAIPGDTAGAVDAVTEIYGINPEILMIPPGQPVPEDDHPDVVKARDAYVHAREEREARRAGHGQ